jgi:hypothetical protein
MRVIISLAAIFFKPLNQPQRNPAPPCCTLQWREFVIRHVIGFFDSARGHWQNHAMPRGRRKNRTASEEIAAVIQWAEQQGFDHVSAIAALRHQPRTETVLGAIQWADSQGFHNIAAALRARALPADLS